jgi:rubrerythrin
MGRTGTRRTFMKECSTSAAAIAALAAAPAGAAGGTPYLCITCGTQFAESARPPAHCPICD